MHKSLFVCQFLQKLYYVHESHGIVVTDVVFLPNLMKGQNIKGNNKAALLSVAVDSRCQVHTVTKESESGILIFSFKMHISELLIFRC